MENTPQQTTDLAVQAAQVAAQLKEVQKTFNELQAIDADLTRIAQLKNTSEQMKADIARRLAQIQTPKQT
jgi:hypothetical protein